MKRSCRQSKSPASSEAFEKRIAWKLTFEFLANNSSQTNQSCSKQPKSSGLRNSGDDCVAASQRHRSGKAVSASVEGKLHCGAIYGRPVVPCAGNRTRERVIAG